jgi:hypothetical protein
VRVGSATLATAQCGAIISGMLLRRQKWFVIGVAVMWIFTGPIAMAFGGCAAMAGMCEAPCGTGGPVVAISEGEPVLLLVSASVPAPPEFCPSGILRVVELPPRSLSLSA